MNRPAPDGGTVADLRVVLPDLRGYAGLLDTTGADLGKLHGLAEAHCVNADFGKILEELTGDYEAVLPQLRELLAEDERRMKGYGLACDKQADEYAKTDDHVAGTLGGGDGISGGSGTSGAYSPVSPVSATSPTPTEGDLPEVSFGFVFNQLAWALDTFTGWDVRAEVTDWIAGDVKSLSTQANCWEIIGSGVGSCKTNIDHGQDLVFAAWEGQAANANASGMIMWDTALEDQKTAFADLGEHLRSLASDAVHTAQLVVDCIRLAIDLIMSAWALQYIPVVGQVKFIKKCWDCYKQANKALAYLKMLVSAIRVVKDFIVVLYDEMTPSSLPPMPMGV